MSATTLQNAQFGALTDATQATKTPTPTLMLVATDGRPQSDSALAVARQLLRPGDSLQLASVVNPVNLVPESVLLFSAELEEERRAQLQHDVAAQTERVWGKTESAELLYGDVASTVCRLARERDAGLIVAGLKAHTTGARFLGNETVLNIMRKSDTPILAVTPALRHIPRRIIVAVDFSETSLQAARLAIELAAPGASITLLHVTPHQSALLSWSELHRQHATLALDTMLAKIERKEGKHVQTMIVQGDAAHEIVAAAERQSADLIAIGTHGHGLVARFILGSVATKVVRASACSVLVFPQAAAFQANRQSGASNIARGSAPQKWAALLDDISFQNIGRHVTIEIDDPSVGAQTLVSNRTFLGATYDVHDSAIAVNVGTAAAAGDHFTHTIANVERVDVLQDPYGADVAIQIKYKGGQAVITFREKNAV